MNNLDSLNIRKGLELEVSVADIFAINTSVKGDILAKEICDVGWEIYATINPESFKKISYSGGVIYNTQKQVIKISNTLMAYVYDSYIVDIEFEQESDKPIVIAEKSTEIEFLNTEILDFDQFCMNIMLAQSFTGKYKPSFFKFSFYGYGNFTMNEYAEVHRMVSLSNVHTLNFFIKYKNIISAIGCFVNGLHRNDIIRQREYLTSKEFATLLNEAEKQYDFLNYIIDKSL